MTGARKYSLAALLVAALPFAMAQAQTAAPHAASAERTGQQDFDWEIGTWETEVRLLLNPLSGKPPEWVEYKGTSVVRPLLWGRANFVELSVAGSAGKIEGGSLRLFNPQSKQWSLNYANLRNGMLTSPVYGGFDASGTGTFYGQDMVDGRAIWVRFVITRPSKSEAHFEQAYSTDGGVSWEANWIATDRLQRNGGSN
jgi:hypothetical protein